MTQPSCSLEIYAHPQSNEDTYQKKNNKYRELDPNFGLIGSPPRSHSDDLHGHIIESRLDYNKTSMNKHEANIIENHVLVAFRDQRCVCSAARILIGRLQNHRSF